MLGDGTTGKHFDSLTALFSLIREHKVAEVIVSLDDFELVWTRVQPENRHKDYVLLSGVKIRPKFTGTMDLTEDKIKIIRDDKEEIIDG